MVLKRTIGLNSKSKISYSFQRQQVVMTEMWAKTYPKVHFSVMHPGWADTPAVRTSMPEFHKTFKDRLRSPEQGGDTITWLCIAKAVLDQPSGQFYLGECGFS